MNWLTNFVRPKLQALTRKPGPPDNLWEKCPKCEQMIFHRDLEANLRVCPHPNCVALTWLGRDDYSAADWTSVREEAARAHNNRTAAYLLGIPQLGDFLEEGLSMLGYSCEEYEIERL